MLKAKTKKKRKKGKKQRNETNKYRMLGCVYVCLCVHLCAYVCEINRERSWFRNRKKICCAAKSRCCKGMGKNENKKLWWIWNKKKQYRLNAEQTTTAWVKKSKKWGREKFTVAWINTQLVGWLFVIFTSIYEHFSFTTRHTCPPTYMHDVCIGIFPVRVESIIGCFPWTTISWLGYHSIITRVDFACAFSQVNCRRTAHIDLHLPVTQGIHRGVVGNVLNWQCCPQTHALHTSEWTL